MGEARSNDLLSECQSQGGEWMLILPSDARAAYALGCQTLGNSKVRMAAGDLIGPGWKARIQAAYIATTRARPIKRLTMRKLTGVSQRTQRYREVQAGVKRTVNYCKSEYPADLLQAFQEFSPHRGIFVTRDNKLAWRLPDIRETDLAERIGRGRVRKANATLHRLQHQSGSLELQRALSDAVGPEIAGSESVTVRLFNSTPEELAKTERKLRKGYGQDVREVYVFSHMSAGGSRMWSRRE
jgi:hypothetical protein